MNALIAWLEWTHAGDLASVAGLVVALIGFAVTIWNVRASRAAALRAEQAALEARRAIGLIDSVSELSAAISALEQVRRAHRERLSPLLPDRYLMLRKALMTVRTSIVDLTERERAQLQDAILFLAALERDIEHDLLAGGPLRRIAEKNARTADHIMELHDLLLSLKRRAGVR